jgi:1,2-diacylglycerol 3-alpha-glucosyltransferase
LDRVNPKVVAIPGWSANIALCALDWCRKNRVPAVVMSDSTTWESVRRPRWREAVKTRLLRGFSSALVAGTPHADYVGQLGMHRSRIFLGYDAVDNKYFQDRTLNAGEEYGAWNVEHNLPSRYFIVSARFIPEKNLQCLLTAYKCYQDICEVRQVEDVYYKAWDLVIVGDGPLLGSVLETRSALGLEESIHLAGFRQYDELPFFYASASCMILPSISETWGLVVNEAMACGLPVLVSNRCGCSADLVREGANGHVFDPLDCEQLANLMYRMTSLDEEQRWKMGVASRRIIQDWGTERFAAGLEEAANKALEVGPRHMGLIDRLVLWAAIRR